ncbi:hypothetical protein WICMUC_003734 [Wickerhamomyces mucosus]|uniref:Box C/D snoRNA protein 1 n=1 Tax=Wickerhamomyces mucosus TaxID=1378264 RepID=A0A9P8PKK8_9ASCO|nr:hypothetical protein WICMUC_003734 [Wickerhamomyces mucosus]
MNDNISNQCQICLENPFKYRCPKCQTKSCSLTCVKIHKEQTQCDGKLNNTEFIKRQDFEKCELLVQRDYNFLTNLNRTITISKQDVRTKHKKILMNYNGNYNIQSNKRFQKNPISQNFEKSNERIIIRRGVNVKLLPKGMSRSSMNKSSWDKKKDTFVWTIEFIYLESETGKEIIRFYNYRVAENTILKDCLPSKIKDMFKPDEDMVFFFKMINTSVKSPKLKHWTNDKPLGILLKDETVIEFPTVIVSNKREIKGYEEYDSDDDNNNSDNDNDNDSESDSESDSDSSDSSDSSSGEDSSDDNDDNDQPEESSSKPQIKDIVDDDNPKSITTVTEETTSKLGRVKTDN